MRHSRVIISINPTPASVSHRLKHKRTRRYAYGMFAPATATATATPASAAPPLHEFRTPLAAILSSFELPGADGKTFLPTERHELPGNAPKDLPRLFETFCRGTHPDIIAADGIGLAIVRARVDLHQGNIDVVGPGGQGTTFTVQLTAPLQV